MAFCHQTHANRIFAHKLARLFFSDRANFALRPDTIFIWGKKKKRKKFLPVIKCTVSQNFALAKKKRLLGSAGNADQRRGGRSPILAFMYHASLNLHFHCGDIRSSDLVCVHSSFFFWGGGD